MGRIDLALAREFACNGHDLVLVAREGTANGYVILLHRSSTPG